MRLLKLHLKDSTQSAKFTGHISSREMRLQDLFFQIENDGEKIYEIIFGIASPRLY